MIEPIPDKYIEWMYYADMLNDYIEIFKGDDVLVGLLRELKGKVEELC